MEGGADIISELTIHFPFHANRPCLRSLTPLQAVVNVGCLPFSVLPVLNVLERESEREMNNSNKQRRGPMRGAAGRDKPNNESHITALQLHTKGEET